MTPATINKLSGMGFVHITGLTASPAQRPITAPMIRWGQWSISGQYKFVVLPTGEVFLARGAAKNEVDSEKSSLDEACPKGQANFTLLENGETLDWLQLLSRHKDATWCGDDGKCNPSEPDRADWAFREFLNKELVQARQSSLGQVPLKP